MRNKILFSVLFAIMIVSSISLMQGDQNSTDSIDSQLVLSNPFTQDQSEEPMGVVVIDNLHDNDYTGNDTHNAVTELEAQGYVVSFTSDFDTWDDAVQSANYLIVPAIFSDFALDEIDSVVKWFTGTSANLLLSSRGDFSQPGYSSMNALLSSLGTEMEVQDDNIYTTDPAAYRAWYIDTDNFNASYSSIVDGLNPVSFFSPSSVSFNGTAHPLIYAEAQAYQSDEAGDPPSVIYDNTNDGTGGDTIPLGVIDNPTIGDQEDRIITLGTTMWSDFDYGDPGADDISLFNNILSYFREETLAELGNIPLNIPDTQAPNVKISYPHDLAYLTGTVVISIDATDAFGVTSYEIKIADTVVSNTSSYTWDTSKFQDGIYKVTATVSDAAGNTAETVHTYFVTQEFQPSLPDHPKVMSYNIKQSGVYDAWFDVMLEEDADVVILIETGDFDNNNNALLNQYTTDLNKVFFDEIPYKSYTLQDITNDYNGITILSRFDILSSVKLVSLDDDSGSNVNIPLPFLHSVIKVGNKDVNIIGGHLTCCPGQSNWNNRAKEQESILNYMDNLGDVPLIYMGDMNSVSPFDVDPASQNVTTDLGTEPIDMVVNSSNPKSSTVHSFTDVAHELGTEADTFIGSILSRIDFIFTNQYFDGKLLSSTTGDTPSAPKGSDHVSVDVTLNLEDLITQPDYSLTTVSTFSSVTSSSTTSSSSSLISSAKSEDSQSPGLPFASLFAALALLPVVYLRRRK